jgi:hypothetical protein
LRGIELPLALLDAASPLVPRNGSADMVCASALASSGDFLLRLAGRQGKHLIAEARRTALPPAGFSVVGRRRPRDRTGATAFVIAVGVLSAAAFFVCVPLL